MSYIGNSSTTQGFTPAVDFFSGNASTTAFTLSKPVASVAQVQAVIENVPQNPGSAYTVSGNTITFTSAPPSGTNNIYVYYTSPITQVIQPSQGTVNTLQLGTINNITSGTGSALTLQTNNGTTAMTIDTSQNVGIGATPSYKVDVNKGSSGSVARFGYSGGTYGYIYADTQQAYFSSDSSANNSWSCNNSSNYLVTYTNGAERMRIDSSGYVGIGTASPSSYGALAVRKGVSGTWLGVVSNCSFETSDAANSSIYMMHSSANSGSAFICSDAGGRLQMFCSSSATGGVYLGNGATSWASASDERVKENLVPIADGLNKVASLRAVTGNYISDESKKSRAFLIAQDVEAVLPEAVDNRNPDELGLAYTDVIPLLVASIKELKALVDAQATEIAQLKAKVG